ncbi:hypothetical protein BS78_K222100 [Paspalum vaginatum]|uniref:Uncharacterized protein n=1 Tax=Paspalum vaginatum TaxID=158149 RepID=A0A9W7XBR3_9POAL|nr:hypothetical protein BS78_K222100 [Paspalum vaginatum]
MPTSSDWVRGNNIGRGLDTMSRSKKGKLPLVIEEGKTRPCSPMIAAKFATECNITVRNLVPIFPRFKKDIIAAPYKKACVTMLKKGIRQQRYKLKKKKYFDPFPLHLVPTKLPLSHMTDAQWEALQTCQGNKANQGKAQFHQTTDEPPNALELFKECHYNKKRKAFTHAVQSMIVSESLIQRRTDSFIINVGIQNKPGTSNAMRHELEAELVREKQGSDELRVLVEKQRLQMDAMAKQMQEGETARAKQR